MQNTGNKYGQRKPESELENKDTKRKLRRQLVEEIRRYHWERLPGQTQTPRLFQTIARFSSRTTPDDIIGIVTHRVDPSE